MATSSGSGAGGGKKGSGNKDEYGLKVSLRLPTPKELGDFRGDLQKLLDGMQPVTIKVDLDKQIITGLETLAKMSQGAFQDLQNVQTQVQQLGQAVQNLVRSEKIDIVNTDGGKDLEKEIELFRNATGQYTQYIREKEKGADDWQKTTTREITDQDEIRKATDNLTKAQIRLRGVLEGYTGSNYYKVVDALQKARQGVDSLTETSTGADYERVNQLLKGLKDAQAEAKKFDDIKLWKQQKIDVLQQFSGIPELKKMLDDVNMALNGLSVDNFGNDTKYQINQMIDGIEQYNKSLAKAEDIERMKSERVGELDKLASKYKELAKEINVIRQLNEEVDINNYSKGSLDNVDKEISKIKERGKLIDKENKDLESNARSLFAWGEKLKDFRVKINLLSPEARSELAGQLDQFQNLVESYNKTVELRIPMNVKDKENIEGMYNTLQRLYTLQRQNQTTSGHSMGMDYTKFKEFKDLSKAINDVTNEQEIWQKSLVDGWTLIRNSKSVVEDLGNGYMKVVQQLRQGSKFMELGVYIDKATEKQYEFNRSLRDGMTRSWGFGEAIKTAGEKAMTWIGVMGAIYGTINQFKEALTLISELDKHFTTLQMEMTDTNINFADLTKQSSAMAYAMGNTTTNVVEAVDVFANYNSTLEETLTKSKSAILLSNLTGQSVADSSNALLSVLEQFGLSAEKSEHVVDILAGTARNLQMDYPEAIRQVYEGIERVGSVADQSQMSIEKLSAVLGTLSEVTRRSGSEVGNAMKTIFSRISNVDEEMNPEEFKGIEKAFNDIGVAIKSDADTIRPMGDILDNLAERWQSLSSVQQNNIATEASGIRQKNFFIALMNNYQSVLDNETSALNSNGVAMQKNDIYLQGLQAHMNRFRNAVQTLYTNLADSSVLKTILDIGTSAINVFGKLSNVFGTLPVLLSTIVVALGVFSTKWRDKFVDPILAWQTKSKTIKLYDMFGKENNEFAKGLEEWAKKYNIDMEKLQIKVLDKTQGKKGKVGFLSQWTEDTQRIRNSIRDYENNLKLLTNENDRANLSFGKTEGTLFNLKTRFMGLTGETFSFRKSVIGAYASTILLEGGITLLITAGIGVLINAFSKHNQKIEEAKQKYAELRQGMNTATGELTEMQNLIKTHETLQMQQTKTAEDKQKLVEIEQRLAEIVPQATDAYTAEGKAMVTNMNVMGEYLKMKEQELADKKQLVLDKFKSSGDQDFIQYAKARAELIKLQKESKDIENPSAHPLRFGIETSMNAKGGLGALVNKGIDWIFGNAETYAGTIAQQIDLINKYNQSIDETLRIYNEAQPTAKKFNDEFLTKLSIGLRQAGTEATKYVDIIEKMKDSKFDAEIQTRENKIKDMMRKGASGEEIQQEYDKSFGELLGLLDQLDIHGKEAQDILSKMFDIDGIRRATYEISNATFSVKGFLSANKENQDELESYNTLLAEYNSGHKISGKQIGDLIQKYPALISAITVDGNAMKINVKVLKDLINAKQQDMNVEIQAEINKTKQQLESTEQRVAFMTYEALAMEKLASYSAKINEALAKGDEKQAERLEHFYEASTANARTAINELEALKTKLQQLNVVRAIINTPDLGVPDSAYDSPKQESPKSPIDVEEYKSVIQQAIQELNEDTNKTELKIKYGLYPNDEKLDDKIAKEKYNLEEQIKNQQSFVDKLLDAPSKIQDQIKQYQEKIADMQNNKAKLVEEHGQNYYDQALAQLNQELAKAQQEYNELGQAQEQAVQDLRDLQDQYDQLNKEIERSNKLKDIFNSMFGDNLWKQATDEFGQSIVNLRGQIVETLKDGSDLVDSIFNEVKDKLSETFVNMLTGDNSFMEELLKGTQFEGITEAMNGQFDLISTSWKETLTSLGKDANAYFTSGAFGTEIEKSMSTFSNLGGIMQDLIVNSLEAVPAMVGEVIAKLPIIFDTLNTNLVTGVTNSVINALNKVTEVISGALNVDLGNIELTPQVTQNNNNNNTINNAQQPVNYTFAFNVYAGTVVATEADLKDLARTIYGYIEDDLNTAL